MELSGALTTATNFPQNVEVRRGGSRTELGAVSQGAHPSRDNGGVTPETPGPAAIHAGLAPFEFDPAVCDPPDDDEIVLFPEFMDGDTAVYRSEIIALAKRLGAEGIAVRYAYPPEQRTYLRELAAGEALVNLAIGIGSGVPWFVLQQLLSRRKQSKIIIKVTSARKVSGRRMWGATAWEVSGSPRDVAEGLRNLGLDIPDE